jgi:rubrerythrin
MPKSCYRAGSSATWRSRTTSSILRLYQSALEMECRTRDHFRKLAAALPEGLEKELCQELASEEDEHIAMLETEMEQIA